MNDFEQQLKTTYSKDLEEKKTWYSSVAEAYDKTRPRYPETLIDRAVKLARLPSAATILELGCGPGTATPAFAQLGFSMVCLEPSYEACQLARKNCSPYPTVEIINTTFEEWELETKRFNAVLAANSFHWLSPEIRCQKVADCLKDKGSVIFLWNTSPQPTREIIQMFDDLYHTYAPSIDQYQDIETHQQNLAKLGEIVIDSGLFENLISEQLVREATYSIDNYLALLSTLSPYIALKPQQRDALFAGLKETLEEDGAESFQTSYLSVVQVAKKI